MRSVDNINGYLTSGDNIFITSRGKPIHEYPVLHKGSQPTDGGYLLLSIEERKNLINSDKMISDWIKRYVGGADFIQNKVRYCLWLKDCPPSIIKENAFITERLKAVSEARSKSPTKSVQNYSRYPGLFTQDRQPDTDYLCLSEVSSINREYIPIGFLSKDVICSNTLQIVPDATIYMFGVLNSKMHNTWVKYVAGRLKSDYRYTPAVYNNFPWPLEPSDKNVLNVEEKAQKIIDIRNKYETCSLAELYDPYSMPPDLVKAHQVLDKAVDLCFRPQAFTNETSRIEFLFELYEKYNEE